MNKRILITILARGGSKGIPRKNIKLLNGYPLIYYTLKIANLYKESQNHNINIVLSTDCHKIKTVVKSFDLYAETDYKRPKELATDVIGKIDAIKDVKNFMELKHDIEYDYVLDLDVTSPLRTVSDLKEAFEAIDSNIEAYNIFSVNEANRNPYFNMVERGKDGFYKLSKTGSFYSRQDTPEVYDLNASFYFYNKSFFEKDFKSAITEKSLIYKMNHICFDLDHPIDFDFMEYLLEQKKLDFKFI